MGVLYFVEQYFQNGCQVERKSVILDTKINVAKRTELGEWQINVCNALVLIGFTVQTTIKNKEKILEAGKAAAVMQEMKLKLLGLGCQL